MSYFKLADLQHISPVVAVLFFAIFVLIMDVVMKSDDRRPSSYSTLIGLATAGILAFLVNSEVSQPYLAFGGMVAIDSYGVFIQVTVLLAAVGTVFLGHRNLEEIGVRIPEYHPLVLFSLAGMMLMAIANDLIMIFVALEIMSIALYVLVGVNRGELKSVEGAFKYFILGAFTSAILLYGVAMIYGATGMTRIDHIGAWLADSHTTVDKTLLGVGFALMLVGFAFKIAAVPFHMWSPDVYQGAPTPITAFMATGVKAASFAAMGRVLFVAFLSHKVDWTTTLWGLAALTMVVGNLGALVQQDLKRMLAYSSIGHAGYLLMAVVGAPGTGLQDNPRVGGLLFYLLTYTIMNIGAFAAVSMMARDDAEDTRIDRLGGLAQRHPLLAAGLTVCLLSLAGIPPTMGFVGKFYLFAAAVEGGFVGLALIGAFAGAIGVYYYLRPIITMYMKPDVGFEPVHSAPAYGALGVAAGALLLLGLVPGPLVDWARESLLSLALWS